MKPDDELNDLATIHVMTGTWSPAKIKEHLGWSNFTPMIDANHAMLLLQAMVEKGYSYLAWNLDGVHAVSFAPFPAEPGKHLGTHQSDRLQSSMTVAALRALGVAVA